MGQQKFDLNGLNGANGFVIPGIASSGMLGSSTSTGDINGDGILDIAVGAPNIRLNNGATVGTVYIIFGSRTGFQSPFNLTRLNGANGFVIPSITESTYLGSSISMGDINGDGIADLAMGAVIANGRTGAGFVIFGSRAGFQSPFNLTTLNGMNGFSVVPSDTSGAIGLGFSISMSGDINGDNINDLVLGASQLSPGAAYVVFGKPTWTAIVNASNLSGSSGFIIPGTAQDKRLGFSVRLVGDVNGDGIGDLALGSSDVGANRVYVVFGSRAGFQSPYNLTNLNGANGFLIPEPTADSGLGLVGTPGDINGDSINDLVLGAPTTNLSTGISHIVFGSRTAFQSPFNLNNLNGANGFTVPGIVRYGALGTSVGTVGDLNNDGISDLSLGVIGGVPGLLKGAQYIIFGNRAVFQSPFNLNNLTGTNGFIVPGLISSSSLGEVAATAGDINGDGISDLVVTEMNGNLAAGTGYVAFGPLNSSKFTPPPPTTGIASASSRPSVPLFSPASLVVAARSVASLASDFLSPGQGNAYAQEPNTHGSNNQQFYTKTDSQERDSLAGQLALARWGVHMAKETVNWIKGWWSKETFASQEQVLSQLSQSGMALKQIKNRLARQSKEVQQELSWVTDRLEEQRHEISVLSSQSKVSVSQLEEFIKDVGHLKDEFDVELKQAKIQSAAQAILIKAIKVKTPAEKEVLRQQMIAVLPKVAEKFTEELQIAIQAVLTKNLDITTPEEMQELQRRWGTVFCPETTGFGNYTRVFSQPKPVGQPTDYVTLSAAQTAQQQQLPSTQPCGLVGR